MIASQFKQVSPLVATFLNAVCGFVAIVICFIALSTGQVNLFNYTFYAIILGIFFDIADGFLARKLNAKSELGARMDSKSDAVSFGVAPAVFLAFTGVTLFDSYTGALAVIIAILYLCSVLFRLARFDITKTEEDEKGHLYFCGFPSPGAALICSAASLAVVTLGMNIFFCLFIYLVNAYLMVSNIQYADLPKHYFYGKRNFLELIPVVLLFFFMPVVYVILGFIAVYECIPLMSSLIKYYKRRS